MNQQTPTNFLEARLWPTSGGPTTRPESSHSLQRAAQAI